jgi:hypothetical protein
MATAPKRLAGKQLPKKQSRDSRPRYSLRQKIEIVKYAAVKKAEFGMSIWMIAIKRNVSKKSLRNWIKITGK